MTKLILSAQVICKSGFHLGLILTKGKEGGKKYTKR